jgi:hypothetical protein
MVAEEHAHGRTIRRFMPMAVTRSRIPRSAAVPRTSIAVTAPTPMTIPSIARNERSLLASGDLEDKVVLAPEEAVDRALAHLRRAHHFIERDLVKAPAPQQLLRRLPYLRPPVPSSDARTSK